MSGDQIVIVSMVAGEDLSAQSKKGLWVYNDSSDSYRIKQISAVTQRAVGVLQANRQGSTYPAEVAVEGGPALVKLGGTINVGQLVTYNASGQTIAATAGRQAVGVYLGNGYSQPGQGVTGDEGYILIFGNKINQFYTYGRLTSTLTHNFPSIGAVAVGTTTTTVTGAQVGDPVHVERPAGLDAGLEVTGRVSALNTVTVTVNNPTANAIDPGSLNYIITVWPST